MGKRIENFFYNDKFYDDIEAFMIDLDIDEETIESMSDFYICRRGKLEPLFVLNADWIIDRIDEERFSEDNNENEYKKVVEALNQIDFTKVNEKIPKLWYESYELFEITKADLYQAL